MTGKDNKGDEKEQVKVDKWDGAAVKNALDDAVKDVLTVKLPYTQNHALMDGRLLICGFAVGVAGVALLWDFLYPFPKSKPILIACVGTYFFLMGILTLYTKYKEKGIFCVAMQKDQAGLDPDSRWEAASSMLKFDDTYELSLAFTNGSTGQKRETTVTRSCAEFIDEEGVVCMELLEPVVLQMHASLATEKKDNGYVEMATAQQVAMCYTDPETGFLMMPGTQRPDGTWRKPRRVKEGYTPQDEVPLYESRGKAIAKARETGHIPGLAPDLQNSSNVSNFKIDTFVIPPPVVTIPGLNTSQISVTPSSSKSKKKKKNNQSATSNSSLNGVNEVTSKMSSASINSGGEAKTERGQPVATDPAKKLRNLRKKLRDIESLEAKLSSGEIKNPEKEQLDKVSRKDEVEKEIKELEKLVEG